MASHTHVARVKQAVAEAYVCEQENAVALEPIAKHVITLVAVDETEHPLHVDGERGMHPLMTLNGKVLRRTDAGKQIRNYVSPPAVLSDTTASTMLTAIASRLGTIMWPRSAPLSGVILGADSCASLNLCGDHYGHTVGQNECFL